MKRFVNSDYGSKDFPNSAGTERGLLAQRAITEPRCRYLSALKLR